MTEADPGSRPRFRRKFLTIGKFGLLVGILIAVGMFSGVIGMKIAVQGTEVETPPLTGLTAEEAEGILKTAGLRLSVLARRYDPLVPEDAILTQSPAAGGRIKAGRPVRVVVSLGSRLQPVPRLVGDSLRIAQAKLMQTEYRLGHVSVFRRPGEGEEQVVQQDPPAGSQHPSGAEIDLLISRPESRRYIMPDVVGRNLSRVFVLFDRQGFKMGNIQYREGSERPRGTVLRQYPEAGNRLEGDEKINLEVAR